MEPPTGRVASPAAIKDDRPPVSGDLHQDFATLAATIRARQTPPPSPAPSLPSVSTAASPIISRTHDTAKARIAELEAQLEAQKKEIEEQKKLTAFYKDQADHPELIDVKQGSLTIEINQAFEKGRSRLRERLGLLRTAATDVKTNTIKSNRFDHATLSELEVNDATFNTKESKTAKNLTQELADTRTTIDGRIEALRKILEENKNAAVRALVYQRDIARFKILSFSSCSILEIYEKGQTVVDDLKAYFLNPILVEPETDPNEAALDEINPIFAVNSSEGDGSGFQSLKKLRRLDAIEKDLIGALTKADQLLLPAPDYAILFCFFRNGRDGSYQDSELEDALSAEWGEVAAIFQEKFIAAYEDLQLAFFDLELIKKARTIIPALNDLKRRHELLCTSIRNSRSQFKGVYKRYPKQPTVPTKEQRDKFEAAVTALKKDNETHYESYKALVEDWAQTIKSYYERIQEIDKKLAEFETSIKNKKISEDLLKKIATLPAKQRDALQEMLVSILISQKEHLTDHKKSLVKACEGLGTNVFGGTAYVLGWADKAGTQKKTLWGTPLEGPDGYYFEGFGAYWTKSFGNFLTGYPRAVQAYQAALKTMGGKFEVISPDAVWISHGAPGEVNSAADKPVEEQADNGGEQQ